MIDKGSLPVRRFRTFLSVREYSSGGCGVK